MNPFVYAGLPCRVVFGVGSLMQLPSEVERLGAGRVLILSTPEKSLNLQRVTEILGDRVAGVYDKAVMHVPLAIAEEARHLAQELGADCCVTVGGGSTTGLGKAIALTIPIFYPMVMGLDFWGLNPTDKSIWFGILALMVVEIGLVHPPVGMNVYIINRLAKDVPLRETFKGVIPFLISDFVRIVLLLLFPAISLVLVRMFHN